MKAFQLQLCDRPTRRERDEQGGSELDRAMRQQGIEQWPKSQPFRDYEPEQAYGTAHDFQEHLRYGGDRENY